MGAPGGGLKQCAQGRGQDRTCGVSPHMPKATFPFVTARQWVDGWRLFFLNTATVSAGHSQPCSQRSLFVGPEDHPQARCWLRPFTVRLCAVSGRKKATEV